MKQKIKIDGRTEYIVMSNQHGCEIWTSDNENWTPPHRNKASANIWVQGDEYYININDYSVKVDISKLAELYYLLKASRKALGVVNCKVK